ncbi:expressed unknown protein [Seminavis robusta]|uniref:Uncharacterized protein n=1 Tax=Seminavis robusta TaxID=568900 RepID=A0A9N8HEH4_9STRA|nr:expressed unknown protein [Seminavis robusta]|eukprot:Sro304_g112600.1 n/a (443) ;mRNA; f:42682-44010
MMIHTTTTNTLPRVNSNDKSKSSAMATRMGKMKPTKDAAPLKKLSPDFDSPIYDDLRASVNAILEVSTMFELKSSRAKGVVLSCGSSDPDSKEAGMGVSLLPLKTMSAQPGVLFTDNPLISVLGSYASNQMDDSDDEDDASEPSDDELLPQLVVGLCCNNWGMYYGRNALIEAILEVMGSDHACKLSIHSAIYALDFNTQALSKILLTPQNDHDAEKADRALHAVGFEATAAKYNVGFDAIEKDQDLFAGVSKTDFVEELSNAVSQAVERTMANDGKTVTSLVMEVLRHRKLIQKNLSNKRFRRAPSQNGIATACKKLGELVALNFGSPDLSLAQKIPGWKDYTESHEDAAHALIGLFCHSVDVLAGCVARAPNSEVTPDLAERLIFTILEEDNRLMEYCFNQVYELMPSETEPKMYVYRRLGDLGLFSTMDCGALDMGGKL